jgi:hypothetical protein
VSRDLLERARPIEQLLEEREWREGHLKTLELKDQLYGDTFYYAAKILLASAIDGPYPMSEFTALHQAEYSPRYLTSGPKYARYPSTPR